MADFNSGSEKVDLYEGSDHSSDEPLLPDELARYGRESIRRNWRSKIAHWTPWILHSLFFLAYTAAFVFSRLDKPRHGKSTGPRPFELPFADSVTDYETQVWTSTDFNNFRKPVNVYEGPPSPESDEAWQKLVDVGMFSITEEEFASLPGDFKTTTDLEKPEDHLVILDGFHQLHCMHMLRIAIYSPGVPIYGTTGMDLWGHIDHCVDYIRQAIQCHADLTPIEVYYNAPGWPTYWPNFNVKRSCRNWDNVYEFALKGNRSGVHMEREPEHLHKYAKSHKSD